MKANPFSHLCRFQGGLPSIVFRDHDAGRIKCWLAGKWIATIVPGHLLGHDCQAVLLNVREDDEQIDIEWRGTYDAIAAGMSVLQQTADWIEAEDAFYDTLELYDALGFTAHVKANVQLYECRKALCQDSEDLAMRNALSPSFRWGDR